MTNTKSPLEKLGVATAVAMLPAMAHAANPIMQSTGAADETLVSILAIVAAFQVLIVLVLAGIIKSISTNRDLWQKRWNGGAAVIGVALISLYGTPAHAIGNGVFSELITLNDTAFVALLAINTLLFFTILYLGRVLNGLLRMMMLEQNIPVPKAFYAKLQQRLTDSVPIEREAEVEMDHEYDGIRELDNNLPPWWLWGFYASIAFGIVYIIHYHVTGSGQLQMAEYHEAVREAEEAKAAFAATQTSAVDENALVALTDAGAIGAGQKTFKLYCAPCHGETGGSMPGGVGPNLTDEHWINGGGISNIYKTIKYGVPAKGMVSWEAQLNPTKILEVASYIVSLRGTNPPNAKEAQGELWVEAAAEAPADSTTTEL